MLWLWILLALAALLVLLCLTRVGVRAAFDTDSVIVDAKVGVFKIRVVPRPEKKEKPTQEKTPKQIEAEKKKEAIKSEKKAAKKAKKAEEKKTKPKLDFHTITEMIRSAVEELLPPVKKALKRIGRGIRIHPLQLYLTLGAEKDPAAGAKLYGQVNAAVWAVMPVLEETMDIREPYIGVDVDFIEAKTLVRGEVGISIRIGTLLAAAFGIGIPALCWLLRTQKRMKQLQEQQKKQEPEPSAAAAEKPA